MKCDYRIIALVLIFVTFVIAIVVTGTKAHPDPEHDCLVTDIGYACVVPTPAPMNTAQNALLAVLEEIKIATPLDCVVAYDRDDYAHGIDKDEEREMAVDLNWILPYTLTFINENDLYGNTGTQIEHMIAAKEAHISGMCERSYDDRRSFGRDSSNLTLALPATNSAKGDRDLSGWLPEHNQCWFARRIIEQKREWNLTMDSAEYDVAYSLIEECADFERE